MEVKKVSQIMLRNFYSKFRSAEKTQRNFFLKFRHFSALKFLATFYIPGHATDFVLIFLKEGKIGLTIHLNSGQLDTAIKVNYH